jgi:hypothetical protein
LLLSLIQQNNPQIHISSLIVMYRINIRNQIVSQTRSIQTFSAAIDYISSNFDLFQTSIGSGIAAGFGYAINSTKKKYVNHLKIFHYIVII